LHNHELEGFSLLAKLKASRVIALRILIGMLVKFLYQVSPTVRSSTVFVIYLIRMRQNPLRKGRINIKFSDKFFNYYINQIRWFLEINGIRFSRVFFFCGVNKMSKVTGILIGFEVYLVNLSNRSSVDGAAVILKTFNKRKRD